MSGTCTSEALGASLRSLGLPVRTSWVSAWLQEGNLINTTNREAAEAALSDVFLCSDLRETGEPQIPPSLSTWHNQRLVGVYVLQLLAAVNISEPHKSRNKTSISKHRCLKLALTDGHVVVTAIEYKHISALREDTLGRGAKVLLYGQPEIRRGILFLQENNLQVLWGGHPLPTEEEDAENKAAQVLPSPPTHKENHTPRPLPAAALGEGHAAFSSSALRAPEGPAQHGRSAAFVAPKEPLVPKEQPPTTWQGPPYAGPGPTGQWHYDTGQGPPTAWQWAPTTGQVIPATVRGSTGTGQTISAGAPQPPPSYTSDQPNDDPSLLFDLEDIADAFGQDTSPLPPGPPQWDPHGPLRGPAQGIPQPYKSSCADEASTVDPAFQSDSRLPAVPGEPICTSVGYRAPALEQNQERRHGEDEDGAPFWLFGAVLDAREAGNQQKEWELLVTDGMRVFLAVADRHMGERMMLGVKQPALFSPIPAVEQLRNVQGHFLLDIKGESGKERQQVHVLSFRANAPGGEITEKLKYLYAAITGEEL